MTATDPVPFSTSPSRSVGTLLLFLCSAIAVPLPGSAAHPAWAVERGEDGRCTVSMMDGALTIIPSAVSKELLLEGPACAVGDRAQVSFRTPAGSVGQGGEFTLTCTSVPGIWSIEVPHQDPLTTAIYGEDELVAEFGGAATIRFDTRDASAAMDALFDCIRVDSRR